MHVSLKRAFFFIGLTFLTLFLATAVTIKIALSGHTPPMDANYYEKGLNYDKAVASQKEMIAKGYDFEADWFQNQSSLRQGKQVITVRLKQNENPVSGAEVKLRWERSATDSFNVNSVLKETSNGKYTGEIEIPFAGSWRAVLTANTKDGSLEKTRQLRIEP
ncbi:FixH family protein [Leptospira idonii]|uniref:Nitrogen fixation protein FixH n=1 Tax=Leptospira idonii TaxID=1193500 RepID=A0A4R9LZ56_9LEPT|nr:FixH family protein [Leptospira idonii]TGN18765.1 nitrogen fixation protein FixH [Leptospira idonii]